MITVREGTINDVKDALEMWRVTGIPWKPEGRDAAQELRRQLGTSNVKLLVAEEDGTVVGNILGSHDERKGWLNHLAVLPEYEGKGVAAMLLEGLEQWFQSRGLAIFAALIDHDKRRSQSFFAKHGYSYGGHIQYWSKRLRPEV
jgi:GNAT superfamily N-acetyltransferase